MRYSKLGYWGPQAVAYVLFAAAAVVILFAMPPGPSLAKAAVFGVVSVAATALALSAYRSADEVILQTHKTAWFWGSMTALSVVAPMIIPIMWNLVHIPTLPPFMHNHPNLYFAEGVLCVVLLQFIGFVAFWAYYNLRRQR